MYVHIVIYLPVHRPDSSHVTALLTADLVVGELEGGNELVQEERRCGDGNPLPEQR